MKSDAEDLTYPLLRIAANWLAKVCLSEAYEDDEALLEALSTALAGRLHKYRKGRASPGYAQLERLQALIEASRLAYAEAGA